MSVKRAYVFVECITGGDALEVACQIRRNPAVAVADVVTGPPDIIAVVDVPNTESLARTVLVEIAGIAGVRKTTTIGVINEAQPVQAGTL